MTLDEIEPKIETSLGKCRANVEALADLLAQVREGRLYRDGGYATFAQYVGQRWGRSHDWAVRLLQVAGKYQRLDGKTAPRSSHAVLDNVDSRRKKRLEFSATAEKREVWPPPETVDAPEIERDQGEVAHGDDQDWSEFRDCIDAAASLIDRTVRALMDDTRPGCEAIQAVRASIAQQTAALVGTLSDNAPAADLPPGLGRRMPAATARGWLTRHEAAQLS